MVDNKRTTATFINQMNLIELLEYNKTHLMTNPQYKTTQNTHLNLIQQGYRLVNKGQHSAFSTALLISQDATCKQNFSSSVPWCPHHHPTIPLPAAAAPIQAISATLSTACVTEQPKWATKKAGLGNISATWSGREHKNIKRVIYDPCRLPVPGKHLCESKCPSGISIRYDGWQAVALEL